MDGENYLKERYNKFVLLPDDIWVIKSKSLLPRQTCELRGEKCVRYFKPKELPLGKLTRRPYDNIKVNHKAYDVDRLSRKRA